MSHHGFDNYKNDLALLNSNADESTPSSTSFRRSTLSTKNKEKFSGTMFKQAPALTVVKKESLLIAKNPKRFLDNYVEGKVVPTVADTSSISAILSYLDETRVNTLLNEKAEDLENKNKLSKTRTLLLNMSSGSAAIVKPRNKISSGTSTPNRNFSLPASGERGSGDMTNSNTPTPTFRKYGAPSVRDSCGSVRSFHSGGDEDDGYFSSNLDKNNVAEVEKAIDSFIEQVKSADMDNIVIWINTLATRENSKHPYGYPTELEIPKKPETVKDDDLRAFVESSYDEFLLLDAEYNAKLEEVGKRLKENYEAIQSSTWSTKDTALLFYVINGVEENPNTKFRAQLIRKLFPRFSEEKVSMQKYRLRMKKAWEEKWGNVIKDWIRDKGELVNKINEGWTTLNKHFLKRKELAKERREQLQRCAYWKDQLEKHRLQKQKRIRRIQIMVEPFEKNLEVKEQIRLQEEWAKRAFQRKLLEQYKKEQEVCAIRARKERERLQLELDRNAKLQAKYNQTRVQIRQLAYSEKLEAQKELERLREEERKLREQLLEKTKEPVEIDYSPANVLADTHSSLMRRHEVQILLENEEESAMIKFFEERYSFSSETVLKDRRVRLEGKLRDAGLMSSSYARQVLMAMEPKPKPHLQSQINFKQESQDPS